MLAVPRAQSHADLVAGPGARPGNRVQRRDADAAARAHDPAQPLQLGRPAQGTDDVLKAVSLTQTGELVGGGSHDLERHLDGALGL